MLWVAAAGRGLARFDKNTRTFDVIPIEDAHMGPGAAAMQLLQDKQGKIWIATWSTGVASFDPVSRQLKTYPYNIPLWQKQDPNRNVALDICEKSPEELYVATQDQGFGVFEKKTGRYTFFNNALSGESPELDRHCEGLYLDPDQRLWVLGIEGGIRAFDFQNETFHYISLASGNGKTEQAEVTDFAFDRRRNIVFVATENSGCYEWPDAGSSLRQRAKQLPGGQFPSFRAVLCDSKGNVWAGTRKTLGGEASLYILRPGQAFFQPVVIPSGMSSSPSGRIEESINDIFEDSNGNIWVGTSYDGLYKISADLRQARRFHNKNGFLNWWFFLEIEEDARGHLWLALKNNGVLDFDPVTGNFVQYDDQNALLSKTVRSLEIGADGNTWIGSNNKGIQVIKYGGAKPGIEVPDNLEGLFGNHISGIEKDGDGNMWIATDRGLFVYDVAKKKFKAFAKGEGLQDSYLAGKGLAIFPGLGVLVGQPNGFCLLRQTSGLMNRAAPVNVVLTDFRIFNKSNYFEKNIRNAREVVLQPSENVFAFEFAAPSSLNAGLMSYRFRLDGFDENWYATNSRESITYTSLQHGDYVFRVSAKLDDDKISPETTLKIRILPHWWQTWWAKAVAALIVISAGFSAYKYRTRQLRREIAVQRQMTELERSALQAQMNPHFIFNSLNSIQNFIFQNEKEAAVEYLGSFAKLVRGTLNASVSGKITLEEEVQMLENYLALEQVRFNHRFTYEVKTESSIDNLETEISPLLIQPYVENAVLHGMAGKKSGGRVEVFFRKNGGCLEVSVRDNGGGMRSDEKFPDPFGNLPNLGPAHKSVGMVITRKRLEMLADGKVSDRVEVKSLFDDAGIACGTEVKIKIQLIKEKGHDKQVST